MYFFLIQVLLMVMAIAMLETALGWIQGREKHKLRRIF